MSSPLGFDARLGFCVLNFTMFLIVFPFLCSDVTVDGLLPGMCICNIKIYHTSLTLENLSHILMIANIMLLAQRYILLDHYKGRGSLRRILRPRIWLKNENWKKSIILYFLY